MGRDGRGLRSRGAAPLPLRTPFVSCFSTSLSCLNFLPKSRAPGGGNFLLWGKWGALSPHSAFHEQQRHPQDLAPFLPPGPARSPMCPLPSWPPSPPRPSRPVL